MVDQSELPYRMLTRKYGAQICYTPMYHARLFSTDTKYRRDMFTPHPEDRPLVVQFCANDPDILLNAARYVENDCDAVDINLGCPQGIAKKGNYGSFLLEKTELIVSMVRKLKENLKVPVTCKIRCLPNEKDTLHLAKEIEKAGASLLTVHGRTRDHNKQTVGPCHYSAVKRIKETLSIPVIINGGISTFADVERALEFTGCDGVMTSEGILEYPALFDGSKTHDMDDLILEYLEFFKKYPGEANFKIVRAHMHKFMHSGFTLHGHSDLRDKMNKIDGKRDMFEQYLEIAQEMKERRKDIAPIDKITWYYRHWKEQGQLALEGLKHREELPQSQIMDCEWDDWMRDDPRNPQSQKAKDEKAEEKKKMKLERKNKAEPPSNTQPEEAKQPTAEA
uniref:tRNA-dihydrouridine(16/17) synthase [NAD(P)(+)] n=1 Tax=Strombidium rassoulzadegani TaxID=1082188 RepID=A0A7S3FV07_9SPIT|mmetsp:Transcript_14462/g.24694  ORF Transcript_14462/g.24694 Transcript_14462/m.24694 type:complete len:393 (+) Transcript_14462:296-1474(+)